jgi:uncharacterized protein YcbK (DUF882 family)
LVSKLHWFLKRRPLTTNFTVGSCALVAFLSATSATQTVVANGDTRTLSLYHSHTHESITVAFRYGGVYDADGLEKLNWFLRDWRTNAPTKMDPRLFDIVWEVYRESGSSQPIVVVSAYRAPETNAMLRRRSSGVAKFSQHILGKAMDMHYVDVPMSKIRELGMRLQRGGVGYYPTSGTPFVHLDAGNVRAWPRMTYDQLARLFPDGKTVHLPSKGPPLPGYEQARAELQARGDTEVAALPESRARGFFATLFGGSRAEEDDESEVAANSRTARTAAAPATQMASLKSSDDSRNFFATQGRVTIADSVARAQQNLPRGETVMSAPGESSPQQKALMQVAKASTDDELTGDPRNPHAAPLPPRRPGLDGLIVTAQMPLPPIRPVEVAALTTNSPRINPIAAALHDNETTGSIVRASTGNDAEQASEALAFASGAPGTERPTVRTPMTRAIRGPIDRIDLVAARLDVANFHVLTASTRSLSVRSQVALSPTVSPLRAAARIDVVSLAARPASGVAIHFGRHDTGVLRSEAFAQY